MRATGANGNAEAETDGDSGDEIEIIDQTGKGEVGKRKREDDPGLAESSKKQALPQAQAGVIPLD